MEKEMEDEVYFPNLGNSIWLLLRRTLVRQQFYSAYFHAKTQRKERGGAKNFKAKNFASFVFVLCVFA